MSRYAELLDTRVVAPRDRQEYWSAGIAERFFPMRVDAVSAPIFDARLVGGRIGPVAVGKFEVTFGEWDACVAEGACSHVPGDGGFGRQRQPVIDVSWNDVTNAYLPWLSRKAGRTYRLLSEAEWEYAARAGSRTVYAWGDEIGAGRANCDRCGSMWDNKQTAPTGSFAPNAFGLHDMHGNVWEWTQDCYQDSYTGAPADGSVRTRAGCGTRVVRGGGWNDRPRYLRSAIRYGDPASYRGNYVGFRVARDR